jgi:hypothetical protein
MMQPRALERAAYWTVLGGLTTFFVLKRLGDRLSGR